MIRRFLTLGTGEAISRVLYLLAFVAIARGVGKAALGEFGLALSITAYLVLVVQQGFDQIAIRAVSRDVSLLPVYVRGLIGLRLAIAAVLYPALVLAIKIYSVGSPKSVFLLILGLTCFTTALSPRWAFQVLSPRHFAIAAILSQLVFCLGALAVVFGRSLNWAAALYLLADLLSAVYLLQALRSQSSIEPSWAPSFWRALTKESWPLSLSALLGIVVYNFDILALGWLASPADLGLYLACYRCATVFSPLFSTLQMSILPAFANAYPDRQRLLQGIRAVAVPTALAATCVALGFTLFPSELLRLIYGDGFSSGAAILRVLAWSLPVQALRSILRQVMLAAHLQRLDTVSMGFAALISIAIDLALIPRLGPVACAFSTLASECVLLGGSAFFLGRKVFSSSAQPPFTLDDCV